jgi:hypothetical protein
MWFLLKGYPMQPARGGTLDREMENGKVKLEKIENWAPHKIGD